MAQGTAMGQPRVVAIAVGLSDAMAGRGSTKGRGNCGGIIPTNGCGDCDGIVWRKGGRRGAFKAMTIAVGLPGARADRGYPRSW